MLATVICNILYFLGGYHQMFRDLEADLCDITGYDRISFQPNRFDNMSIRY